jgi:hypothetical protein
MEHRNYPAVSEYHDRRVLGRVPRSKPKSTLMPYGVAKTQGGDTRKNDAWMERCILAVQAKGKDKVTAIRICKAQLAKRNTG